MGILRMLKKKSFSVENGACGLRGLRGFSLLELLVIVMFVGVLGGLAVRPIQQGIQSYKIDRAASMMISQMRRAQSLSRVRGTVSDVFLNHTDGTIVIRDAADPSNLSQVVGQLEPGIVFRFVPSGPVRFFPRGFVRGGTIILGDRHGHVKSVSITASGRAEASKTIRVQNEQQEL